MTGIFFDEGISWWAICPATDVILYKDTAICCLDDPVRGMHLSHPPLTAVLRFLHRWQGNAALTARYNAIALMARDAGFR